MIAVDPRTERTYVTFADRQLKPEERTVWRYKPMTVAQQHAMGDDVDRDSQGNKIRREEGSRRLLLLRTNLTGWDNLSDGKGGKVEPRSNKYGMLDDDVLERIPFVARVELAIAIENDVAISPDEVGKSEPPSI